MPCQSTNQIIMKVRNNGGKEPHTIQNLRVVECEIKAEIRPSLDRMQIKHQRQQNPATKQNPNYSINTPRHLH